MSGFYNGLKGQYALERLHDSQESVTAPELIYKSIAFGTKEVNEPAGRVTAAVNSLDVLDFQKDIIHRGAWTPVIDAMSTRKAAWPSVLLGHDHSQGVGTVRGAWEGDGALYADLQFNMKTQRGRDAFSDVAAGVYKEWSVGFLPADDGHEYDAHGIHHITKVAKWPEVSMVVIGASPGTRTLATKSAGTDLESVLSHAIGRDNARRVMAKLNAPPKPAPIPRPADPQPFDFELNDPERAREWRWDEAEGRYVRRVTENTWRVAVPAPRPAGQLESMDETLRRWARGGYGQIEQPK